MSATPDHDAAGWARTPERSNAMTMSLMAWIAMACGRRVTRVLLHPITLYFMLFAPDARRHSKRFLQRALGRKPQWVEVYRHFHAFSAVTLDRVYLLRGRTELFDIELHGATLTESAMTDGRGAFLVGAHMGSFEVLRAVGQERGKLRIAMVMYPDNARLINETLRALAPVAAPAIIALGRMGSMLAVRDWLDGGGLAGMLGDRVLRQRQLPGASTKPVGEHPIMFLGREAEFGDGPFRLAAMLKRRVIFMVGIYLGANRYEVRFEVIADFSDTAPPTPPTEREQQIRRALERYASLLESVCRSHPTNWFNFHDFWQEDRASRG